MQEAIARLLERYSTSTVDEAVRALREILQEVSLLGLWRAKFFEHAAFYGDTALRIFFGLDRFSEDLDFTLLRPELAFDLGRFTAALEKEIQAFGFKVSVTLRQKAVPSSIQSAFLKANTRNQLLLINVPPEQIAGIPRGQILKIRLEVDTDPPPGFSTETRYLLQPIPFPVRVCDPPDLFACKIHALLFRRWEKRVKGRDWYDFVWLVANRTPLHLAHLEQRIRQTGDWTGGDPLSPATLRDLLTQAIDRLDVEQARREVLPFLKQPESVSVWSEEFFKDVARRIEYTKESRAIKNE